MDNEKILVVIPSANDQMIVETINRMIYQAQKPENLHIVFSTEFSPGIFESMFDGKKENQILDLIDTSNVGSIKHIQIEPNFINGPSSTRHHLCKMKTDESYFLSIDAHTSFGINWDTNLIELYKSMLQTYQKPLISGWLEINISDKTIKSDSDPRLRDRSVCNIFNSETGDQKCTSWDKRLYSRLVIDAFGFNFELTSAGITQIDKRLKVLINDKTFNYIKKQILCAQYMFTSTKWIDEVNFSNNFTFKYEEPYLSLASYLAGYDILDFETQYLSNLSVSSHSKDRAFTKYRTDYGYKFFTDFILDNHFIENQRSFKSWLKETNLICIRENQQNDFELDLNILSINEIKNR